MTTGTKMAAMPPRKEIDTSTYSGRVAQRMRDLRTERGWTVKDLAERVKLDSEPIAQQTLHNWDRGKRKIDPDFYPAIAKAFGISLNRFLPKE
jgi:transcriptional regulator with XRE-family HTH domain